MPVQAAILLLQISFLQTFINAVQQQPYHLLYGRPVSVHTLYYLQFQQPVQVLDQNALVRCKFQHLQKDYMEDA